MTGASVAGIPRGPPLTLERPIGTGAG